MHRLKSYLVFSAASVVFMPAIWAREDDVVCGSLRQEWIVTGKQMSDADTSTFLESLPRACRDLRKEVKDRLNRARLARKETAPRRVPKPKKPPIESGDRQTVEIDGQSGSVAYEKIEDVNAIVSTLPANMFKLEFQAPWIRADGMTIGIRAILTPTKPFSAFIDPTYGDFQVVLNDAACPVSRNKIAGMPIISGGNVTSQNADQLFSNANYKVGSTYTLYWQATCERKPLVGENLILAGKLPTYFDQGITIFHLESSPMKISAFNDK